MADAALPDVPRDASQIRPSHTPPSRLQTTVSAIATVWRWIRILFWGLVGSAYALSLGVLIWNIAASLIWNIPIREAINDTALLTFILTGAMTWAWFPRRFR